MDPAFDECGEICGETDEVLDGYCDTCPMKEAQDDFHQECTDWLEHRQSGGEWKKFGVAKLIAAVLNTVRAEELPLTDQSAHTGKLISILNGEKQRIKRIEAWNEKIKTQNQT